MDNLIKAMRKDLATGFPVGNFVLEASPPTARGTRNATFPDKISGHDGRQSRPYSG